jgi:imidazole glycerol phosphate synthase subunit HisF
VLQAFTSALSREVRYSGAALVLLTSAHLSGSGVGGEGGLMDTVLSLISLPSMAEVGNLVPVLGSTMIALGCAPARAAGIYHRTRVGSRVTPTPPAAAAHDIGASISRLTLASPSRHTQTQQ